MEGIGEFIAAVLMVGCLGGMVAGVIYVGLILFGVV